MLGKRSRTENRKRFLLNAPPVKTYAMRITEALCKCRNVTYVNVESKKGSYVDVYFVGFINIEEVKKTIEGTGFKVLSFEDVY